MGLIAGNLLVWMLVQGFGTPPELIESICAYGLIPGELLGHAEPGTRVPIGRDVACVLDGEGAPFTLISSMFMHGSWLHILFNMWFLWIFGDNVEDVMGPVRFVAFYLLCGLAAAAAQIATDPESVVPMVGASGAIGGVMGAYARLFPRARVHMLVFFGFFITTVSIPAVFMLGYWFLLQIIAGLPALGESGGGVAFWAHAGGFVAGVALSFLFVHDDRLADRRRRLPRQADRTWF